MANFTVNTAAAHITEEWVNDVIRAQEFDLVIAPKVFRQWKYVGHGEVFHIPRVANLTTNSKAASTAWTPEAITDSDQTLVINVHEVCGIQVEDITDLLAKTDVKAEYQKKLGYSLGRSVDVNLAALPQNFSQIIGNLGDELVYEDLVEAWEYIADAGLSVSEDCTWFFSPGAVAGFLKQDIFINALYQGDGKRAVQRATIGDILGAPVVRTNLTRAPAAGQSESFLIERRAIALMMAQEPKMVTEYIAKELSWVVGSHQIYGYVEVNRYVETAASTATTDDWAVLLRTVA